MTFPVGLFHERLQGKLRAAVDLFDESRFNTYDGPERPELLVVTSSVCNLYCREAVSMLGVEQRVGILKLGTAWPLPRRFLERHLSRSQRVMVVEEVLPFLEDNLKALATDLAPEMGLKRFHGKASGDLPALGEMDPDRVAGALEAVLGVTGPVGDGVRQAASRQVLSSLPGREWTFCPGCPHRASFWSIQRALRMDGRGGFVCGDIGCYTLGILPTGFCTLKLVHAMGSGIGVAGGFGQLGSLGMTQPVVAVCGDSTFFHTGITGLINAVHHDASVLFILMDNGGTAMTGFQPHPGTALSAMGRSAPGLDAGALCRALGVRVELSDPFDLEGTQALLTELLRDGRGTRVLILRQACALSPERKAGRRYAMAVDAGRCQGAACGCNRLCTRVFRCPGLVWDPDDGVSRIDEVICAGCGVCAEICPAGAIRREATP
jgi:indolepyruvate ferredoxin oxidoreductase alpha subunit